MIIKKAILHVIDREGGNNIFSQTEVNIEEKNTYLYLEGILKKFIRSDVKTGNLTEENEFKQLILKEEDFIQLSIEVTKKLDEVTSTIVEMPNFDLLFLSFSDEGVDYWSFLKCNHKKAFTHLVEYEDQNVTVQLIENQAILPAASQKVEEGLVVNLSSFEYQLVEKKYILEGKRCNYLSKLILKEVPAPSIKDNISVMKRAVKEVADKYQEDTYMVMSNLQQAVYESIEEDGTLVKEQIAEALFPDNYSAKTDYLEKVEAKGFTEEQIVPDVPAYEKKYSKQKLKLANGIELIIPNELYSNQEYVEFVSQPDGTISVFLKNIDGITNKFS